MPVTRGMLRPGGDGSMKSFIIILTVVGLMFLMYYKYKLTSYTSTPEIAAGKESVYVENKMAKEVAKEIASLKEQMNRWKDEYHTCKTDKEVLEIRQKEVVIKKGMENELDNMRKKLYDTNDELKIQKEKVENLSKRLEECTDIAKLFKGNGDQREICKLKVRELNSYCGAEMGAFVKKTMPYNDIKPSLMTKDENSLISNKQSGVGTEAFIESDGKNQPKGKLGDKSILISGASDKKFNQQRTIMNDGKYLPKILHHSNVADVNKNAKQADNVNAGGKEDLNDADGNKMVIKMPFFNDVDDSDGKIKSPVRNASSKMVSTLKMKDNDSSLRNDSNNNDNNDDDDGGAVKNDNKNDGSELSKNRSGKEMKNNDDSNFNSTGNDNENVEYGKDDENADDNTTNETNVDDDKRLMINDKYPIEKVLKTAKNKAKEEFVNQNDFSSKKFYKRSGSQTTDQQQQQQQGQSTKQPQQKLKQSQMQQQSLQQQQQQQFLQQQPKQLQRQDSSHLAEKQQQKSSQPPPPKSSNFSIQHEQLEQQSKKLQKDSRNELISSASMPTKSNKLIESKEKSLESRRKELASILDGQQNDNQKTPDSKTSKLDKLEDKLEDVADDDEDVPKKENSIRAGNQNVIIRNNYTNNDIFFQRRNRF